MKKDELLKIFKENGIEPGQWHQGGGTVEPQFIKDQIQSLKKVKILIEKQIEKDLKEIQKLRELQKKIEHGGNIDNG